MLGWLLSARHQIETLAVRAFVSILKRLSPDLSSLLVGKAVRFIGPLLKRSHRADENLKLIFPELRVSGRKHIIREMWENVGRIAGEYPHIETILSDRKRIRLSGMNDVKAALVGHKAALLLSAHFGNWEMTLAAGRAAGLTQANVYRPVDNQGLDELLVSLRGDVASGGLIAKGDGNMRQMMRALKDGISIGMLVDQREDRGVLIPFLGKEAYTLHGPALLARRMNVPIFLGVARRREGVNFEVECRHIPAVRTEDAEQDAIATTRAINDQLSEWIKAEPEQWFWFHNRWRLTRKRSAE